MGARGCEDAETAAWEELTSKGIARLAHSAQGKNIAVIGAGPSLQEIRPAWVKDCYQIAVNDGIAWSPQSELHFTADCTYPQTGRFRAAGDCHKRLILPEDLVASEDCGGLELRRTGGKLYANGSSVHAALHLALLMTDQKVLLLGVDLGYTTHVYFHGGRKGMSYAGVLLRMTTFFNLIAHYARDRVIDCSPQGRLHCFRKVDLANAVERDRLFAQ